MDATAHHDGSTGEAWRTTTIAELDMYTTSGTLGDHAPDQPIVSSTYLRDGKIRTPQPHTLTPADSPSSRATLKEGDLAVVLVRRTGEAALVTDDHAGWTASRSIGIIRGDPHVVKWLRIWLHTPTATSRIKEDVTAHVEPTLSIDTLRHMPFPLPPPNIITRYDTVFRLIDEMIQSHQTAARRAMELADAIHDDYCASTSPPWRTRPLGEVVKAKTGKGSVRSIPHRPNEPGVDVVTPADLFDLPESYVENFPLNSPVHTAAVWPPGTFMLSTRPDGAHIAVTQHPATPIRGVVALQPTDDNDRWWLLHELRSRSRDIAQAVPDRNSRDISARAVSRLNIAWPDQTIRDDFHTKVDPLHVTARQLVSSISRLRGLKDAILRDISSKARAGLDRGNEPDNGSSAPS